MQFEENKQEPRITFNWMHNYKFKTHAQNALRIQKQRQTAPFYCYKTCPVDNMEEYLHDFA